MFKFTRIIPGKGCDLLIIEAEEGGKSALWDAGMFYCGEEAAGLVKKVLKGRNPDYLIMSHTHYDHIGALSVFRKHFPEIIAIGSEYAAGVLQRESARNLIREMSEVAAREYLSPGDPIPSFDPSGLYADSTVKTGDIIDFGREKLKVYNTPGHTRCSISLFDEESKTLLSCETTGVYESRHWVHMPILTGYKDALDSIDLCLSLKPRVLIPPHLGNRTMELSPLEFLEKARECARFFKDKVLECAKGGLSHEETMDILTREFHTRFQSTSEEQPVEAFRLNTEAFIKCLKKEFAEEFEL